MRFWCNKVPRSEGPAALILALALLGSVGCKGRSEPSEALPGSVSDPSGSGQMAALEPTLVSEPVTLDSDDPAIWIHPEDPARSLILGTDKGGFVYVFGLDGKIIPEKSISGLERMNNIDIEYGLSLGGKSVDIAVATERPRSALRVWTVPEMQAVDNGGIPVFEGETGDSKLPMGVALYKRPGDGAIFAIVSRKTGPAGSYLWQYRLEDDGSGQVKGTLVRRFGDFSGGQSEIESVAIDDPLGYVYYSDELFGVRKYAADPDAPDADAELALFGTEGFAEQREGISIYRIDDGTGYILVSDQQAANFRIFRREGEPGNPHEHREIKVVKASTNESDGSETTSASLGPAFPAGLFVAMSDDKTFQFYSWPDIAGDELLVAPDGRVAQAE